MIATEMAKQVPLAARRGFVPETGLAWLEALRLDHESGVEGLRGAHRALLELSERQEAEMAGWAAELFELAAAGGEPPVLTARLHPRWLAGERVHADDAVASAGSALLALADEMAAAIVANAGEIDRLGLMLDDFDLNAARNPHPREVAIEQMMREQDVSRERAQDLVRKRQEQQAFASAFGDTVVAPVAEVEWTPIASAPFAQAFRSFAGRLPVERAGLAVYVAGRPWAASRASTMVEAHGLPLPDSSTTGGR